MGYFGDTITNSNPSGSDWAVNVRMISSASNPVVATIVVPHDDGTYSNLAIDNDDNLRVNIHSPKTVFGEIITAKQNAIVQGDFVYGFSSQSFQKFEIGSSPGSFFSSGSMFCIKNAPYSASISTVKTARQLKYKPGQGASARFTAMFGTASLAGCALAAGVGDQENAYFFTHLGPDINAAGELYIGHRNGARRQIVELLLTAASLSSHNVTVTLNGSGTLVPVTATTVIANANQIAAGDYNDSTNGWQAYASGSTVTFVSKVAAYQQGTYGMTGTVISGAFSTLQNGRTVSVDLVPQSQWNNDHMNGSGSSGMVINPHTINIFQIDYGYLGIAGARYSVVNEATGEFTVVHRNNTENVRTALVLENPSMPIFWSSTCYTNVPAGNTIFMGSCAGFIQGEINRLGPRRSFVSSLASISTTFVPVFSIRVPLVFRGVVNKIELFLRSISAAVEATKPVDFVLLRNATIGPIPTWNNVDESIACSQYDKTCTTVTGGIVIYAFSIGKAGDSSFDLIEQNIAILPGETITIASRASSGNADVDASLSWVEDF